MPSTRRRNKCRPIFLLSWLLLRLLLPAAAQGSISNCARPFPHHLGNAHGATWAHAGTQTPQPSQHHAVLGGPQTRSPLTTAATGRALARQPEPTPSSIFPAFCCEPGREGWRKSGFEIQCLCWIIPATLDLNKLLFVICKKVSPQRGAKACRSSVCTEPSGMLQEQWLCGMCNLN